MFKKIFKKIFSIYIIYIMTSKIFNYFGLENVSNAIEHMQDVSNNILDDGMYDGKEETSKDKFRVEMGKLLPSLVSILPEQIVDIEKGIDETVEEDKQYERMVEKYKERFVNRGNYEYIGQKILENYDDYIDSFILATFTNSKMKKDMSKIFCDNYKDVITISSKNKEDQYYLFNVTTKIWEPSSRAFLISMISDVLKEMVDKYIDYFTEIDKYEKYLESLKDDDEDEDNKKKKKSPAEYKITLLNKTLEQLQQPGYLNDIAGFCITQTYQPEAAEMVNRVKHLLPIKNGKCIDLRKGEVIERTRAHFFTFFLNYNISNKQLKNACGKFRQYDEINNYILNLMCGDQEVVNYLQYIIGYFLTGETNLRSFFMWYGAGANGKSLLLELISKVLGDTSNKGFSKTGDMRILTTTGQSATHLEHLSALEGSRLVSFTETEEGERINTSMIKKITGEDSINLQRKNEKAKDNYKTDAKLLCLTNNKIEIPQKQAEKDRLVYIHFGARFVDADNVEELKKPYHFIKDINFKKQMTTTDFYKFVCWCVQGAYKFYEHYDKSTTYSKPQKIINETNQYMKEQDNILKFFEEEIEITSNNSDRIERGELYSQYSLFYKNNINNKSIGLENNKHFFDYCRKNMKLSDKKSGVWYFTNIKLKEHDDKKEEVTEQPTVIIEEPIIKVEPIIKEEPIIITVDEEKENLKKENNQLKQQLTEMSGKMDNMMAMFQQIMLKQNEPKKEEPKTIIQLVKDNSVEIYKSLCGKKLNEGEYSIKNTAECLIPEEKEDEVKEYEQNIKKQIKKQQPKKKKIVKIIEPTDDELTISHDL